MVNDSKLSETVRALLPSAASLLRELIAIPSLPGHEAGAMTTLEDALARARIEVHRAPMSEALKDDPDYSDPAPGIRYEGRHNLRAILRGSGRGRTLVLNTHVDVVPPSEDMADPWGGRLEDGIIHGRGACDAKGQVATLYLVLRTLDALGVRLKGNLIAHFVNEEENGGNGTLAMIRQGEAADGCVVMEPTDRRLYTSIRGAVWFRLTLKGKAGHSGQSGQTRSALLMARDAMNTFEKYHADLLAASRGFDLFDGYPNPMPLTFGKLSAGSWPASAPSVACLEGVLGFLPNKTREQVCQEMRQALLEGSSGFSDDDFDLEFTYRHDSSVVSPDHDLPKAVLNAARASHEALTVSGMTASCDAWFYNNLLNIPTVVYGPGSLKVAHSKNECVALENLAVSAEVLSRLIMDYCGTT
jgi:acetylornithine deacetylase